MKRSKLFIGLMVLVFLLPATSVLARNPTFFIDSKTYVHYHEPVEQSSGTYHQLVADHNRTNLGFTYDAYIVKYGRVSLTIHDVKNVGEYFFFYLGGVTVMNDTHIGFAPFIFEAFYVERSMSYDYRDIAIYPEEIVYDELVYFERNGYAIGDIVVYVIVVGTITHSVQIFSTIDYYEYNYHVSESWIDDVTEFDSITDYFLAFLTMPLILMSSSDELTFWLGVGLLIIEIMFVVGTVYKFVEAWL